jgi:hypothetical protein
LGTVPLRGQFPSDFEVDDFRASAPGHCVERALAGANPELQVISILADYLRGADDFEAERGKQRGSVVRAERLELLKRGDEGIINLLNRCDRVDVQGGFEDVLRPGRLSRVRLRPAAYLWPPKVVRCPEQAVSAAWRSKPVTERPEPLPRSFLNATTIQGREKRSTSLAATMPMTPSCQPSAATTIALRSARRSDSTSAIA